MSKVSFSLVVNHWQRRKSTESTQFPIYLNFPVAPKRLRLSTGIFVHPSQWDTARGKVNRKHPSAPEINRELEVLAYKIESTYRNIYFSGQRPTLEQIKGAIIPEPEKPIEIVPIEIVLTFWDYFEKYFEAEKIYLSENSKRKIRSVANLLKAFEKDTSWVLSFENIGKDFYTQFVAYLVNERNQINNSIGKQIRVLKRFLNYSLDQGWHTNTEHQKSTFKAPKDQIQVLSLSKAELHKLYTAELPTKLAKARDLFIFGCFTGLRIGDILRLKPEHITEGEIRITTQKNIKQVRIPLTTISRQIVERYQGNPILVFPPISQQKARDYLKEAAQVAGLERAIVKVRFQLAKRIETTVKLHKIIGFHHAKRTAVSLMLQNGLDRESVLQITGNNSTTIEHYINIENEHTRAQFLKTMDNILL